MQVYFYRHIPLFLSLITVIITIAPRQAVSLELSEIQVNSSVKNTAINLEYSQKAQPPKKRQQGASR